MPSFTEKSTVEDYILQELQKKGWRYVNADSLERESYDEPLLLGNLLHALRRINNVELTESDLNKILAEIKSQPASIEGVRHVLRFFKQGVPIKLEKSRDLKYIDIFDYENYENNEFIISNQVNYESGRGKIIADIVLYVNGIPLVAIECKNPTDPNASWEDAYNQIKYYENVVPELFKYVQFSIAAEETAAYFPNVIGEEYTKTYTWKEKGKEVLESTLDMLDKGTLLDLIRNFTFIREERGQTSKVIARYMQYEAVNLIYERVANNMEGRDKKNSGLIWHWQGSGKTLTMVFACYKLFRSNLLENPTIFFIVDRDELEEQLKNEFSYIDLGIFKHETVSSVKHLKELLFYDSGRGKKGVFITLIHKFQPNEMSALQKLLKAKVTGETIINRKNVVAFIDEGHRTQYGSLSDQMRSLLRNAFFFAFTGTPISKKRRDTYLMFSYPEEGEKYLHKYFMKDSIEDGFTLPIIFQTRMEKKVHLKKALLERFLKDENIEEIPEDIERKVSRKLNDINVRLENPVRIQTIAEDVTKHFRENINGKFKAMVVAANRKSCVRYKRALDKLIPPECSEVVMTYNPRKDPKELTEYLKELEKRYGKTHQEAKDEIVEKFKKEDSELKILVVTDMLLTGFNAPILQVMYLDKPLKEHRLLQAIARTNRPFKGVKESGLILDYVGILKDLEKAVAIYDREDVINVIKEIGEKDKEFGKLLLKTAKIFQKIDKERFDRETLLSATDILIEDDEKSKQFSKDYKKLRLLFEFLRNRISNEEKDTFRWLTAVYQFYNRRVKRKDPDETDILAKKYFYNTLELVYKSTEIGKIKEKMPVLELNPEYLEKLRKAYPEKESRVYDMLFTLHKFVLVDRSQDPVFEPIAEKINKIIEQWKQKRIDLKEAYAQLEELVNETISIEKRRESLGLSKMEYSMFVILESRVGKSEKLAEEVKQLFSNSEKSGKIFPGWNKKPATLKDVGKEIRKFLWKFRLSKEERDEVYERVIKGIKQL